MKKTKCDYPNCNFEIIDEDLNLKPTTAKLCEKHNEELLNLTNSNNIPKLVAFMMKVAFK